MLGKGLESLIPPQKKSGDGQPQGTQSFQPPEPQNPTPQSADFELELPEPSGPQIIFLDAPLGHEPEEHTRDEEGSRPLTSAAPASNLPVSVLEGSEFDSQKHIGAVFHIEVEKIKPNPQQPRKTFDESSLRELATSIREFGILQPLVVSKIELETSHGIEVEYQLIAGERRLMAAKLLGLERVPAIIRRVSHDHENLELAVIENLQRENLNPIEMARAYTRLQEEFRLTQREIASKLGKSRESVANTMRLLDLPPYIQEAIEKHQITESHGRLLLGITDQAAQKRLFDDLLSHNLTTRELKHRVGTHSGKKLHEIHHDGLSPELRMLQERLSSELGAPVKIMHHGDKGNITISFYSKEELDSILNRLQKNENEP